LEIEVIAGDITKVETDAIVVGLFEDAGDLSSAPQAVTAVDKALEGAVSHLVASGEVKGKFGEVVVVHTLGKLPAGIVAVAGLGKRHHFTLDRSRGVAGEYCRALRRLNCRSIGSAVCSAGVGGIGPEEAGRALAEGSLLGLYSFTRYRKPEYGEVERVLVVERQGGAVPAVRRGCVKGRIMAEAAILARDMVNEPANGMTPTRMADTAAGIARKLGLQFQVFGPEEMEDMGMGALLGVARGSAESPRLLVLGYRGSEDSDGCIGLVGKGVTFDSGGISIKPSEGMGEMKDDMAGGAAVIAALSGIAQLECKVNVTAIVPAAENLPSGSALKPGDIVKAMNGKTIEVISTDAEGRLLLADALSYAVKQGLSPLVDVATLTGACRIALGPLYSGTFGNNQELVGRVIECAGRAGERFWQMPMPDEYKEQNKSEIADIKNTGNRYGGAITAALFLSEFVDSTPWAHIDIAGTVSSNKESGYTVKGATGVGARALMELGLSLAG
jgi:leucyl aminopeptidase